MSLYYDTNEEKILMDNLQKLCTEHRKLELQKNEPTADERIAVKKCIFDFIKRKSRIIYGGYAYHVLIMAKSSNEFIYSDLDFPDVEFYTTDLIGDVKELCQELFKNDFKYIRAEEGVHPTTMKLKINEENYCDITFVPPRLHDSIPVVKVDGLCFGHPNYLYIDVYKVYSYPLSNYFRLTKTFKRANLLMKHYPLELETIKQKTINEVENPYLSDVYKVIKSFETLVLTDVDAYNFYCEKAGLGKQIAPPFIVAVSTEYNNDVKKLYTAFKKIENLQVREFYPFLDYLGRRIDFIVETDNKKFTLLQVYDETDNCIPYKINDNGHKVSTIQSTFYYLLITRQKLIADYYTTKNRKILDKAKIKATLLMNLIKAKKTFYQKNKISTVDHDNPFQEFVVKCQGTNVTTLRKSGLLRKERKAKGWPLRYSYEPNSKASSIDGLRLDDFTGSEIKKESNLTLKEN